MKRRIFMCLTIVAVFVLFALMLDARAGGAGGGGSHSSGGGGGFHSGGSSGGSGGSGGDIIIIFYILFQLFRYLMTLPFPFNILSIGAILAGVIYIVAKGKKTYSAQSVLNDIPTGLGGQKAKGLDKFMSANPTFNEIEFKEKVRAAFLQIQDAWMTQDLRKVRKFLSDGVYQRFNTQFKMMQLLKQKDMLANILVNNVYIDKVESDGKYDIINVGIYASMNDSFESELDPTLNKRSTDTFVEFWSFMRKRGVENKDMFHSDLCPSCQAPLPEGLGEVGKCQYCNALLNSGEFDWVLSEITQSDDYATVNPKVAKANNLNDKMRSLVDENDDFSVQLLEDKASNGYLQILTALTFNKPDIMRRFVSDKAYEKLSAKMRSDAMVTYNRLYLNDVTMIGARRDEAKNYLAVAVKSSFQRVALAGGKTTKIDETVMSQTEVVIMCRDIATKASKGSIYAHQCPSCGGVVNDTTDVDCQYCGNVLNSSSNEWIIDDVMSVQEYMQHFESQKDSFAFSVSPVLLDSMYDVRDFAFNNIMVLVSADGVYGNEEKEFVEAIAKKWGYNLNKIQSLLTLAESGRLVIKMPEKIKDRKKIFTLMNKAAMADGTVQDQEQKILDQVKETYLKENPAA